MKNVRIIEVDSIKLIAIIPVTNKDGSCGTTCPLACIASDRPHTKRAYVDTCFCGMDNWPDEHRFPIRVRTFPGPECPASRKGGGA